MTVQRSIRIVLALAVLVLLVGGFAFWRLVRRGFGTHEAPSALEVMAARSMRS